MWALYLSYIPRNPCTKGLFEPNRTVPEEAREPGYTPGAYAGRGRGIPPGGFGDKAEPGMPHRGDAASPSRGASACPWVAERWRKPRCRVHPASTRRAHRYLESKGDPPWPRQIRTRRTCS